MKQSYISNKGLRNWVTLHLSIILLQGFLESENIKFSRVETEVINIEANAGTTELRLYSNDDWNIYFQEKWLTFSATEGKGNHSLVISWEANATNVERIADIEIRGNSSETIILTIKQRSSPIKLLLAEGF